MQDWLAAIPFLQTLGVEVLDVQSGTCQLALTLTPELQNSWGAGHGGVIMTLLDTAMSLAGRSQIASEQPQDSAGITIEMKTNFIQPARAERLLAIGRVVHRATSLSFCEASVHDQGGELLATASGTFKFVRAARIGAKLGKMVGGTD